MHTKHTVIENLHSPLRPQLLFVAAKLGLADILKDGRLATADELARDTRANPQALARVLRGLVMLGIVAEHEVNTFSLTSQGEILQSEHADSIRDAAIVNGELMSAWSGLLHAVQTGEPAFDHVFGVSIFKYLEQRVELSGCFNRYIAAMTNKIAGAVTATYDFSRFRLIVDVGGGTGVLLAHILARNPLARGILFDLSYLFDNGDLHLPIGPYLGRCDLIGGDFFKSVPANGDAYILQLVLHDWNDERARLILRNCRDAMNGGKVLIVERLITSDWRSSSGLIEGDLDMLVLTGGCERTELQIHRLCASAGLKVTRLIPLWEPWAIIEAEAIS